MFICSQHHKVPARIGTYAEIRLWGISILEPCVRQASTLASKCMIATSGEKVAKRGTHLQPDSNTHTWTVSSMSPMEKMEMDRTQPCRPFTPSVLPTNRPLGITRQASNGSLSIYCRRFVLIKTRHTCAPCLSIPPKGYWKHSPTAGSPLSIFELSPKFFDLTGY